MSKFIAVTLGDPAGIGPEIVAASIAAADGALRRRLRVYCDQPILEQAFAVVGASMPALTIEDRGVLSAADVVAGQPDEQSGAAQIAYLESAIAAAKSGNVAALVTAPISKLWARRVGFEFPGHTELLGQRLNADSVAMMFAGPRFRVVLATIHERLADVPKVLTSERIVTAASLAIESVVRDFGVDTPSVGVLGLNPHAGEGGMFGDEEKLCIVPAIDSLRSAFPYAHIDGPLVPDAAYRSHYDLYVAMYHDQALIPVKLVDDDASVNVTLGLPIVRTSPDHGVAYDIAGRGVARSAPMTAALDLAVAMMVNRD